MVADCLTAPLLAPLPHGFSTRAGLDPDQLLPGAVPVALRQVHSPDVLHITSAFDGNPPPGDAMVTDRPGLVLRIFTADCAPVLFADPEAGVIGAAHAGWRGALAGVIGNTVAAMEVLGARRAAIRAVIGPTIAQQSYEVDAGFHERFCQQDRGYERFFVPGAPGHFQFDLPGFVAARITDAGVGAQGDLALDTYADPAQFCSYRRATHRGEPTGGRQISAIGLPR